jgi:hypothetical protein
MPSAGLAQRPRALAPFTWPSGIVVLIILAAAAFRISAYGDIRTSVGTMDTQSYMAHAGVLDQPNGAFQGERLLTTGLLYRLWGAHACELEYISIPAIGKEMRPGYQDCFAGLASTQVALSLVGWSVLIAAVASILEHAFPKVTAAVLLSVFAFAPQLADWDSVLSSESLAISLFALWFGLGILALKVDTAEQHTASRRGLLLFAASISVGIVWVLVRDAHVYVAIPLLAILLLCAIVARPRRRRLMILAAAALAGCLLILAASQASGRWRIPLTNAFSAYVLPFPERVRVMQSAGMPQPGTRAYDAWFADRAPGVYAYFLLTHPRFILTTVMERVNSLFVENSQPYFKTPNWPLRDIAFTIGDLVHTKSASVLTLDLALVTGVLISGARRRQGPWWPIAILVAGLFATALITLVLTFFADSVGVERHVMLSVMLLRLVVWISLALIVDMSIGGGRFLVAAESPP